MNLDWVLEKSKKLLVIWLDVIITSYLYKQPINKTTTNTFYENISRRKTYLKFALKG